MSNLLGAMSVVFNTMKPTLAMVALQFGFAGMYVIVLISMNHGFSHWALVIYRHALAAVLCAPFAYFLEKKKRPKMTKSIFLKIALLGFLEPVLDQNLYYAGMKYTSATFASANVNILPALTFVLAIIFRLEKINLKESSSLAKVIGTIITVTGAMLMTLYKGPVVNILWYYHGGSHHKAAAAADQHWVTGTILLLVCMVGWSGFFIVQNITFEQYPAGLSLTTLVCVMGAIEGGIAAVIMEHQKSAWAIGFDSRLLATTYSGIVCSGIAYYVQSVVNKIRGPLFVTAFSPLSTIITAVLGAIVLAEQVHLGSLIGAVIIVVGLYSVVWGKSKEIQVASNKLLYNEDRIHELPVADKKTSDDLDSDNPAKLEILEKKILQQAEP